MPEFYNMSIKEFFMFLEERRKEINKYSYDYKNLVSLFEICCENNEKNKMVICHGEKIRDIIKTPIGKNKIKNILVNTLGDNFFSDCITNNFYNYEELKSLYTSLSGLIIKVPTNFDELVISIESLMNIYNIKDLSESNRLAIRNVFAIIERLIGAKYNELLINNYRYNKTLELLEKTLNNYNLKRNINLNSEEMNQLKEYLNKIIILEKTDDNGKSENIEINFGDITNHFINSYNTLLKEEQERKTLKPVVNRYYKKIVNIGLDNLENTDMPSFDDKYAYLIYNMLNEKFVENINKCVLQAKKDSLIDLKTVVQMKYADYIYLYRDKDEHLSHLKEGI